ncbi:MAG: nicotinate (nicotinamide) nucleotide adenylyltransferase [Thermoanaerobaculia bacterium]
MKIGLFGGSFDPPHWGHVLPVEAARERLGLARVWFLPTARPPHKPERRFAPSLARLTMVELATLHRPGLFVSPFEVRSEEPSYTIDSVEHFGREYPEAELVLLLGLDSFVGFHTWRRFRDIARLARLAVLARPGWEERLPEADPEVRSWLETGRAELLAGPAVAASSSALRAALAQGELPADGMVPDLVLDYIAKYSLYR